VRLREGAYLAVVALTTVSIGFLVPLVLATHGLMSSWIGLIVGGLAVVSAALLAFFGFVFFIAIVEGSGDLEESVKVKKLEDTLRLYRARQRAMLEEMDEIVELLREIRDLLKAAGEV